MSVTRVSFRSLEVAGAWDSSLEHRMSAAAVGLLTVRVAAAAARVRSGAETNSRDRRAAQTVASDLRQEANVLRGVTRARARDEAAYEVAGAALTAMTGETEAGPAVASDSVVADRLDGLAGDLEKLASGESLDPGTLKRIEDLFQRAGANVQLALGHSGEFIDTGSGEATDLAR